MFYLAFCDLRRHLHLYLFIHLSSSLQIWKLQAALSAQSEITKYSQQEYERLQTVQLEQKFVLQCSFQSLFCAFIVSDLVSVHFSHTDLMIFRKRSYAEFVSKNRSIYSCFHAGITSYAGTFINSAVSTAHFVYRAYSMSSCGRGSQYDIVSYFHYNSLFRSLYRPHAYILSLPIWDLI